MPLIFHMTIFSTRSPRTLLVNNRHVIFDFWFLESTTTQVTCLHGVLMQLRLGVNNESWQVHGQTSTRIRNFDYKREAVSIACQPRCAEELCTAKQNVSFSPTPLNLPLQAEMTGLRVHPFILAPRGNSMPWDAQPQPLPKADQHRTAKQAGAEFCLKITEARIISDKSTQHETPTSLITTSYNKTSSIPCIWKASSLLAVGSSKRKLVNRERGNWESERESDYSQNCN